MVKFFDTEKKIGLPDIYKIEEYLAASLPDKYKNHLLKYNGGRCEPNVFSFLENGKLTESNVDWFLAVYDGEYDNLKEYIKIYKFEEKRLPSRLVPIAHDPGGNLICIDLFDGKIYFWDHEEEIDSPNDEEDWSNIYLINNDFDSFITGLHELE